MVSSQNPNPTVSDVVTNRGFVPPAEETRATAYQPALLQRSYVGWGGVIAGMLLSIGLLVLSAAFAYACGVPAFAGGEYGWGAGIWSVVTALIAFSSGGCLAAYMAPSNFRIHNMIHGVAVWALAVSFIAMVYSVGMMAFGHPAIVGPNVTMMTINGNPLGTQLTRHAQIGPAWGAFISLFIGLLAAALGGFAVRGRRD